MLIPEKYAPHLILLLIVCGIAFLPYILAHLSGWKDLEKHYRFHFVFRGEVWNPLYVKMSRQYDYTWWTLIVANREVMYLKTRFIFTMSHAPLFIPRRDISISEYKFKPTDFQLGRFDLDHYYPYTLILHFKAEPEVSVIIKKELGEKIAEVAMESWPGIEEQ